MRWAVVAVLLGGCSAGVQDAFFVRRDGADLPVWLQGSRDAQTFVVVQHGSGASGKVYDWQAAFDTLEARHAFVYWDQRGAGISQGNAPADTLTLDDSVQDLDLVLDVVRERYDPQRLVLLGHSLGGGLSLAFLRDPARAEGIDGYVDVCGGRNLAEAYDVTRGRLLAEGRRLADDEGRPADERAEWAELVAFYEARPDFPREEPDRSTHGANVERVLAELGFDQAASTAEMGAFLARRGLGDTLLGTFDNFAYGANTARFLREFDIDGVAMGPEDVATVPVPALVLAGRFDFAIPVEVTQATFDAFAVDLPPSRHVVLESSAHFPMWDEPDPFSDAVLDFIDALP